MSQSAVRLIAVVFQSWSICHHSTHSAISILELCRLAFWIRLLKSPITIRIFIVEDKAIQYCINLKTTRPFNITALWYQRVWGKPSIGHPSWRKAPYPSLQPMYFLPVCSDIPSPLSTEEKSAKQTHLQKRVNTWRICRTPAFRHPCIIDTPVYDAI